MLYNSNYLSPKEKKKKIKQDIEVNNLPIEYCGLLQLA